MSDWKEPLGYFAEMVTDAPDCVTVSKAQRDAKRGLYWPISGDETTKSNKETS